MKIMSTCPAQTQTAKPPTFRSITAFARLLAKNTMYPQSLSFLMISSSGTYFRGGAQYGTARMPSARIRWGWKSAKRWTMSEPQSCPMKTYLPVLAHDARQERGRGGRTAFEMLSASSSAARSAESLRGTYAAGSSGLSVPPYPSMSGTTTR